MNEVTITGVFDREFDLKQIKRATKDLDLTTGSLNFVTQRGDKEVKMWIDVEAVGSKAHDLAGVPLNMEVTVTGRLERAAWQDKQTGDWRSKHFIRFEDAQYQAPESAVPVQDDIPF